jgi:dienelactone hydrolase
VNARSCSLAGLGLALVGCASPRAAPADSGLADATLEEASSPVDAGAPDALDAIANADVLVSDGGWLSDTVVQRGAGLVIEQVVYPSGGLRIHGLICRPDDGIAHPLLVANHGGFDGLVNADQLLCQAAAGSGFVALYSSYRGEDGSDGEVEVCHGEIDDVRALVAIAGKMPYGKGSELVTLGQNQGGCITLQLALQDPGYRAAVDFFGPTDWAALDGWWHAQVSQGEPAPFCQVPDAEPNWCAPLHQSLIQTVEGATGGTPAQQPGAYAVRSTLASLAKLTVPTLILHGTYDPIVVIDQACSKRAALLAAGRSVASWYQDVNLVVAQPSTVCGGGWQVGPLPDVTSSSAWTSSTFYFLIYEQQGDGFYGNAYTQSQQAALSFLIGRL